MNRLVDLLSRMLDPGEREAVRGDLAESGATGGQTLCDVLGLVIRRQAGLWMDWRPWFALVGLVVPLGVLLVLTSRRTADGSAIYIWSYLNNWTWTYLTNPGFRLDLLRNGAGVLLSYFALTCWSWASGFVLARLARLSIWVNGALFCLILLLGEFLAAPQNLGYLLVLPRAHDHRAAFAPALYDVGFPLLVVAILVLLPGIWGMRKGPRALPFQPLIKSTVWAGVVATIVSLVAQNSLWWQVRTWELWPLRLPRLPSLLPIAGIGPAIYIIAWALCRRARRNTIPA